MDGGNILLDDNQILDMSLEMVSDKMQSEWSLELRRRGWVADELSRWPCHSGVERSHLEVIKFPQKGNTYIALTVVD